VRRYWRGDPHHVPVMADRLTGSALQFDHSGRPATASVNMLTAHDGFTLADVVSFVERHNEANGEDNRDGHSANWSDNFGVEGPSTMPLDPGRPRAEAAQHDGDAAAVPGHADDPGGRRGR
jgi:isoamylase